MKHVNYDRMLIAFMLVTSVAIACYFIIWMDNEEGYNSGFLYHLLNAIYSVTAFPNKIFEYMGILQGWPGFFLGVLISGLFYCIAIEIVLVRYAIKRSGYSN